MCAQCVTKAVSYGECLPGFHLMKAAKTDYPDHPNMQQWVEGQYGLVECNDPTFYLSNPPLKEADTDAFWDAGRETDEDICASNDVRAICRLVEAAKTKGYNPKEDGIFGFWLTNYLAIFLETATPIEDTDSEE